MAVLTYCGNHFVIYMYIKIITLYTLNSHKCCMQFYRSKARGEKRGLTLSNQHPNLGIAYLLKLIIQSSLKLRSSYK